MIVFSGQISGKCKKFALGRESKLGFIGTSIASIIFSIPIIIAIIQIDLIFILGIFCLILIVFLATISPKMKNVQPMILPTKVIIDTKSSVIITESSQFHEETMIRDVVKVLDMGEWYHIYPKNRSSRFICQKSLISQGTLKNFERVFKDKIIVSNKELPVYREVI